MKFLVCIFVFCTAWAQQCKENIEAAYHIQFIMSGNLEIRSMLDTISFLSNKHGGNSISEVIQEMQLMAYDDDFWDKLAASNDVSKFSSSYNLIKYMIKQGRRISSLVLPKIEALEKLGQSAIDFITKCLSRGPISEEGSKIN